MASSLNIRDIGADRKLALEAEAARKGVSVSEVVRGWIDDGIALAASERAKAAWIAAAKEGLSDEAQRLKREGPSLARYRTL